MRSRFLALALAILLASCSVSFEPHVTPLGVSPPVATAAPFPALPSGEIVPTPDGGEIVLPPGMEAPPALPEGIDDPALLEAWIWMWNTEAGRPYAEYLLEEGIPIEWTSGASHSRLECRDDYCTYPPGSPIRVSDIRDLPMPQRASALAGLLAHEVNHRMQPYGQVPPSLYEEFYAYYQQDAVMAELAARGWGVTADGALVVSGMDFAGYDPLSSVDLERWFAQHQLGQYVQYVDDGLYLQYPPGLNLGP